MLFLFIIFSFSNVRNSIIDFIEYIFIVYLWNNYTVNPVLHRSLYEIKSCKTRFYRVNSNVQVNLYSDLCLNASTIFCLANSLSLAGTESSKSKHIISASTFFGLLYKPLAVCWNKHQSSTHHITNKKKE